MAHSIETFEDLVELLEKQPDLRPRLLRVLLTDEFLRLPEKVDRLEEALTKLTHEVFLLTQSHRELENRVGLMENRLELMENRLEIVEQGQKLLIDLTRESMKVLASHTDILNSLATKVEDLGSRLE